MTLSLPRAMSKLELDDELDAIAKRRALRESGYSINASLTELAAKSGMSFLFLEANTRSRSFDIARRWGVSKPDGGTDDVAPGTEISWLKKGQT